MKLKTVITSFTLLTVFTALAGLIMYYNSIKTGILKENQILSRSHVKNIDNSILQLIGHYRKNTLSLSRHKEIVSFLTDAPGASSGVKKSGADNLISANQTSANEILDLFNSSLETSVCYILNKDGIVTASSNRNDGDSFMGKDYSFRPYFINSIKGNPFVYMAYGVTSGRRGIYFTSPVYNPESKNIIGVAVIKQEVDKIENEILFKHYPTHVKHKDFVFLVNEDGIIFISDHENMLLNTLWQLDDSTFKQILLSKQFGNGPWPWAGFKKINGSKIIDQSGRNYDLISYPVKNIPGWKVVHLSDFDAIWHGIYASFFKTAGYVFFFVFVIIGFVLALLNFLGARAEKELKKSEERYRMAADTEKQARESLRKERDLMERIMETSPSGIIRVDANGLIIYANRRGENILGVKLSDSEKRNYNGPEWKITDFYGKYFPPDKLPFNIVKKTGKSVFHANHAIEWPDGRRVFLSVNATPLLDSSGNFDGMVAAIDDITEKYKAEQNYKMLFNEMLDGFALHEIICDSSEKPVDYRFLAVNPAFERLTGLKASSLLGKTVLEVMPGTESHWIQKYGQVALTGKPAFFENFSQELNRHFQVTAFRPAKNQFACILVDISERKKMEDRLLQAQKMESIGSLASGIAHDFNNILFPIIGMAELLLEDLPPKSLEYENVQEILKAGKRAGDLVGQILAFSRQSEHKIMPVRIQQVLKEVLKLSRSTIPSDIEIIRDIQSDCGLVMANPTQIHQIAMNLITNAFHAVESNGGKISVLLREIKLSRDSSSNGSLKPGKYAMLTISDTGHGIKPEILHKIFDPYFTTKDQGKGTGLGLSIVYGIIKGYKGDLKVYSKEGKGTTFDVYLPLMEDSVEIQVMLEEKDDKTGTERILLVDDEESVARLEKQMLERLGYHVTYRTSSIEGLKAFKSNPDDFDLVITDMTMPNLTGDQLAKELIAIKPDIPIVICTGFSERINKEKTKEYGIRGFLMKPVLKTEMARMVRRVLDKEGE